MDHRTILNLFEELTVTPEFKNGWASKRFSGLLPSSKSFLISALLEKKHKIFLITTSFKEAQWLKEEITVFSPGTKVYFFETPDALSNENADSPEITGKRFEALYNLKLKEKCLVIAPIRSVMHKTEELTHPIILKKGEMFALSNFINNLIDFGYKRLSVVGEKGEFSVRGGIVDVFSSNNDEAVRLEFFEDKVESLRCFDPITQRSYKTIEEIKIAKNKELRNKAVFDVLPKNILLVFDEEEQQEIVADQFVKDIKFLPQAMEKVLFFGQIKKAAASFDCLYLSSFLRPKDEPIFSVVDSFVDKHDSLELLKDKIILITQHINRFFGFNAVPGLLRSGFKFNSNIILSDKELFGIKINAPNFKEKKTLGVGENIKTELEMGDYVVHEDYGIGIYKGLHKIEEGEFILIEFAASDKLYVPPQSMGRIGKYVSKEGHNPKLSRMGGSAWRNLKAKVKKSVKDLTQELLALYAQRNTAEKNPYPKDDIWQKELEDSFPYEETKDQLKAIIDMKKDLESPKPMDRLLCGDVGFGKTEVALRAIVKVAASNKQVAVLVPTTILADQHYHYFRERLAVFPLKIEMLSRFKSKDEQKKIIEELKLGEVNIVVGTHRLLQKDIAFKDLGLLIIDEEHRFGVLHKEKLKKLKKNIDILSMTATPIPRTLYLSLSGTRDLSLIQTPPADRSPVKTYITPFNEALVREAIVRELDRGGQIFFVHNRIETIEAIASRLKKLIPEAKVSVAHGGMHEAHLEKIMQQFLDRENDVLICTAIIESGLDIANANTIIINNADKLGIAQLYQLRGRVGRSSVRAYAYLLYDPKQVATESSLSRLYAISEFGALGSGYKLALRDLEIRGAGNLLGSEQHGHILAVGFDLYCELLEEAVKEIKGIKELTPHQTVVDIKEEVYIPNSYIEDEQQRIAVYRRLNLLSEEKELQEIKTELRDRFGNIPTHVLKLMEIVALKIKAQKVGIKSIRGDKNIIVEWINKKTRSFRLSTNNRIREITRKIFDKW